MKKEDQIKERIWFGFDMDLICIDITVFKKQVFLQEMSSLTLQWEPFFNIKSRQRWLGGGGCFARPITYLPR